jgi:hypothetical protein
MLRTGEQEHSTRLRPTCIEPEARSWPLTGRTLEKKGRGAVNGYAGKDSFSGGHAEIRDWLTNLAVRAGAAQKDPFERGTP